MSCNEAELFIVGTSVDPHIDAVLQRLDGKVSTCRLDVDQYPENSKVSIDIKGSVVDAKVCDRFGNQWDVSHPKVLWFRRLGKPGLKHLSSEYKEFSLGEIEQTIEGLLSVINPIHKINGIWETRLASNKIRQYLFAAKSGLITPHTLISNSPEDSKSWLRTEDSVAKSLSRPVLTTEASEIGKTFVYTNRVTSADIRNAGQIAAVPVQFQRLIKPEYELRVTSFRGEHHVVAIKSSDIHSNRIDWRATATECKYWATRLSSTTSMQLTHMMKLLRLDFAASDFIVDNRGQEWFLESNPNGAWLWLEAFVDEFKFTDRLARQISELITGSK